MPSDNNNSHIAKTNSLKNSKMRVQEDEAMLFEDNTIYHLAVPITWVETKRKVETIKNESGKKVKTKKIIKTIKTTKMVSEVTGKDLNYAVRTVYAEAGGLRNGTQEERKAMADLLTNRIGASNISGGIKATYTGVVQAPKQFQCYIEKSNKFACDPKKLKGNAVKEWNLAYDAMATEIKECGGSGPKYTYTFNLKAGTESSSGWVQIGASVFKNNDLVIRETK
jgi:hypothetical protein